MLIAASFFIRVFIYGLVGFVPESLNEVHVLLPKEDMHRPYITFEVDCQDCESGKKFESIPLDGHKIELKQVTERQDGSPPIIEGLVPPASLPDNRAGAEIFAWVPSMAIIFGDVEDAQVEDDCIEDNVDEDCLQRLAARMTIRVGRLKTCQLATHPSGNIFSFKFKKFGSSGGWEQALAEVVRLDAGPFNEDSVTLVLKGRNGKTEKELLPFECTGSKGTKCIDIFITNMTEREAGPDRESGPHFKHLYAMLDETIIFKHTPHKTDKYRRTDDVQPHCRCLPDPGYEVNCDEKSIMEPSAVGYTAGSPWASIESRSVCPMVVLSP